MASTSAKGSTDIAGHVHQTGKRSEYSRQISMVVALPETVADALKPAPSERTQIATVRVIERATHNQRRRRAESPQALAGAASPFLPDLFHGPVRCEAAQERHGPKGQKRRDDQSPASKAGRLRTFTR
jgi:hypothetical protein